MRALNPVSRDALLPKLRDAFDFAQQQVRAVVDAHPDYSPMYTVQGKWAQEKDLWTHWCEGFFPSQMWMFHDLTKDPKWRGLAERYTVKLESRKDDRNVHDLGFIFLNTYGRWYRLTRDRRLRDVVVQAGRTLALRFKEKGAYLCSFIGPDSLFIDIMMNVPVIFWAAIETGDDRLMSIASRHCLTSRRYIVRGDGSTAHEGIFDLNTGEFLRQSTHQGYRSDSCWVRGLTWALYGFATSYRLSGDARFLETSQACADCYIARCGEGLVPPWDFDAPEDPERIWDSSAGAIAASGLQELANLVPCPEKSRRYRNAALTILDSLTSESFLARYHPGQEGLLLHGVYHKNKGLGVDESVAWGDHFFVEAIYRALSAE
ncbi:MAG: glucuronyl hydrolase [Candidatus Handelsmanbacteria bacterium RIFCSPLOWO2_12_FULL_64_10]|uniref:Glucuronyl hydrolase n=1 Tax=Handelsmanbacteria sp. (strain RIFCSPLOWO2_12_FULL_64_10) TaxID=1817868 RepID=A0A1F6CCS0_HANXR|nr:MAG: glucuronyl hydrolase [Candidatus Handelsmanbacteria bacterium RIFCSPLOWO2_12_FULL_64_10]